MQSSWYEAFRSDMRSNVVVRAVESSVGRIGWATHAATSWTSSQLAFTGQGLRYLTPPNQLQLTSPNLTQPNWRSLAKASGIQPLLSEANQAQPDITQPNPTQLAFTGQGCR